MPARRRPDRHGLPGDYAPAWCLRCAGEGRGGRRRGSGGRPSRTARTAGSRRAGRSRRPGGRSSGGGWRRGASAPRPARRGRRCRRARRRRAGAGGPMWRPHGRRRGALRPASAWRSSIARVASTRSSARRAAVPDRSRCGGRDGARAVRTGDPPRRQVVDAASPSLSNSRRRARPVRSSARRRDGCGQTTMSSRCRACRRRIVLSSSTVPGPSATSAAHRSRATGSSALAQGTAQMRCCAVS